VTVHRALAVIAVALAVTGCRSAFLPEIPYVNKLPPAALARLSDASGNPVGYAVLSQGSGGVRILVDVTGLPPGTKAVHLHEVGRCDPPSFESAGPHVNPTNAEHGTANPKGPHAGDLPNLTVDAAGRGHLEATAKRVNLEKKGPASLLDGNGSALVIHEREDDNRTDPAGNSGPRLACGVIVSEGKR
jgi:Cu-Zn family superoxide dismutase